jgi:hypothetical protein
MKDLEGLYMAKNFSIQGLLRASLPDETSKKSRENPGF